MAQQVEHVLGKDGVTGSNPVSSSTKKRISDWKSFFHFAYLISSKVIAFITI